MWGRKPKANVYVGNLAEVRIGAGPIEVTELQLLSASGLMKIGFAKWHQGRVG